MSYLRGPMTRDQIELLTCAGRTAVASAGRGDRSPPPTGAPLPAPTRRGGPGASHRRRRRTSTDPDVTPVMPEVAGGVAVRWVDPAAPWLAERRRRRRGVDLRGGARRPRRPALRRDQGRPRPDEEYEAVLFPLGDHLDVTTAIGRRLRRPRPARRGAEPAIAYRLTDAPIAKAAFWSRCPARPRRPPRPQPERWSSRSTATSSCTAGPVSGADDFAARCRLVADDQADAEVAKLRDKYEAKVSSAAPQIAAADDAAEVAQAQQHARRRDDLLSSAGLDPRRAARRPQVPRRPARPARPGGRAQSGKTSAAGTRVDAAQNKVGRLRGRARGDRGRAGRGPHRDRHPLGCRAAQIESLTDPARDAPTSRSPSSPWPGSRCLTAACASARAPARMSPLIAHETGRDPCRWRDSNPHWRVPKTRASAVWATPADRTASATWHTRRPMEVHDLPTPALVIEVGALDANLADDGRRPPGRRAAAPRQGAQVHGPGRPPARRRPHDVHVRHAAGGGRHGRRRARRGPARGQRGRRPPPPRGPHRAR